MSNIEIIKTNVPPPLNTEILDYLSKVGWKFAADKHQEFRKPFSQIIKDDEAKDYGMFITTHEEKFDHTPDKTLNDFGRWIFHLVNIQSKYNLIRPTRMYWNYYTPQAMPEWHIDESMVGNYVSIFYNLHDYDGGTEFQNGERIESKEGDAIVFPSHLVHRGYAPVRKHHRFNLNMIALTDGNI